MGTNPFIQTMKKRSLVVSKTTRATKKSQDKNTMITREQFYKYVETQYSGAVNMVDIKQVVKLTGLKRGLIYKIMDQYNDLVVEYGIPERFKSMNNIEVEIYSKVEEQINLEKKLQLIEESLMDIPQFKQFLDLQRSVNERARTIWSTIEEKMIENNIKKIQGDFGTITVAERQNWDINEDELPNKFYKKVVDTKKITDTFRLTGKAPKGANSVVTKYLTKRLK